MKIQNNLLRDAIFRQSLEANFKLIEKNIEEGTLWSCGITSKGITIVRTNDSIVDKIVFLVKELFGYINTSYASMQELKQRVELAELTALKDEITTAQQRLDGILKQGGGAEKDWREKTDQVKAVSQELDVLTASVNTKKGEISQLEKEIAVKQERLTFLEGKLKAIAKEEELEAKLQACRIASQEITKEVEEITEGLNAKHAELISCIGNTELGLAGWLVTANQMIKETKEALNENLSIDKKSWDPVASIFRSKFLHLRDQISLIINSKQYFDFLSQVRIIETTSWSGNSYGNTYTIQPTSQSHLHKNIFRQLKDLAKLTFTRSRIMALTV